jgi:hypothetical protein
MKANRIILLGLLLGCVAAPNGRAATLRAMKLADLVRGGDMIFVGTAVSSVSAWNAERTRIYTRTTFQVEEYLKGYAGETVVIETLGGKADGIGMLVPGMPAFNVKSKHLIFTKTGRVTGTHRVLGWAQGNFRVHKDPHTGREAVSRDLAGVTLVGGRASEPIQDLDQLKDAIHQLNGR